MDHPINKTKTVLLITHSLLDPVIDAQVLPYLKVLSKLYHFHIMTYEDTINKKNELLTNKLAKINEYCETKCTFTIIFHNYHLRLNLFIFVLKGLITIVPAFIKYNISLIHSRNYLPSFVGVILKKLFHVPFIFDMRGLYVEEQSLSNKLNTIQRKYLKYFEKKTTLNADKVITVSEKFKDFVINDITNNNLHKDRIYVIPNGFDNFRFHYDQKHRIEIRNELKVQDKTVMVYSGSLHRWQMIPDIINIFSIFKNNHTNAYLLFLTYEPIHNVLNLIDQYGINDCSQVLNVSSKDVGKYLSAGDFAVLIREDHIVNRVSSPLKFSEYLACGLPVLLTKNIGDTSDIVNKENIGISIKNINEQEIIKGISQMILLLKESNIHERCYQTALKKFTVNKSTDSYFKIYKQLI